MPKDSQTTDVLIIGGGPAGTAMALGLLAYSELSVVVIESTAYDTVRIGEHVAPSLLPLLDYLQVKDIFSAEHHLHVYSSAAAWGSAQLQSRDSLFSQFGETYQLDRELFDQLLAKKVAQRGGTICPRTKYTALERLPKGDWRVFLTHRLGETFAIKARFLVDATGRQFHVSRKLAAKSYKYDALVGVGAFLHFEDDGRQRQNILLETVPEGWWYSATLPGGRLAVVLFTDADILAQIRAHKADNWNHILSKTIHTQQRAQGGISYGKPWVKHAYSHLLLPPTQRDWLAVGDAAAAFDPLSSLGVGFAITSACHASRAVIALLNGDPTFYVSYYQGIKDNFLTYLDLRQSYYQIEQRWPESSFWQRRHQPGGVSDLHLAFQ